MTSVSRRGQSSLHVTVYISRSVGIRAAGLGAWLSRLAPPRAAGEVAIAIAGDGLVRRLNRDYRGVDRATDVLSFPVGDEERHRLRSSDRHDRLLGDIVIAAGVARRQAREAGHSVATEVRLLSLHGLLHLLGYDHDTDSGQMARIERRLRRKGGLSAGLIERVDA